MKDENKTKAQLIDEMAQLRQRVAELEQVGTKRQSAQQALGEWQTTFDAMSDWVCLIEPATHQILYSNRYGEEMLGLSHAEVLGQSCCRLLHGSDQPLPGCPVIESLRTRQRATLDLEAPDVHRWFSITVDPVLDDHGDVAAVVHIARDITQRKRAEESLAQRTQDLALIDMVNEAANRGERLADVIELLSSELKKALPCNGATLYLLSDDQEYLVIQNLTLRPSTTARIEKLIGGTIPEVRIRLKEGNLYRRILDDGHAQVINDAETIKRLMAECTENRLLKKLVGRVHRFLDIHSVISVPLMQDGEAVGLLDVSRSEPFSAADVARLAGFAPPLIGCLQRMRTEVALRESEDRHRLLFESSPICLWEEDFSDVKKYLEDLRCSGVSDVRAYFGKHPEAVRECASLVKVANVNRAALDLYQAETKAELLRGLDQVFTEESYDVFIEELVSIAEGRTQFDGESSARTLGGERRDIALRWNVFPGFEETLARVVVSDVDITERKRAEEALRESEERFRYLSEAAFEAIVIHDGGVLLAANDQFYRMFGFEPGELVGKQAIPLTVAPEAEGAMSEQMASGSQGPYESIGLRKDGTRFPMEIRAREMSYEGREVRVATAMDITERKRAEEALRESEARYRELANSITDVFFAMDEDLRYTFWNQASENLTGISARDALRKSIFELFPDREDTRRAAALYREVLKTQQPQSAVNDYQLGGEDYSFEIAAYPSGSGLSVFTKDITERRKAEQEIRQRNEELLALNAIAETLSSSLNVREILNSALHKVLEILAVEAGGIYLVDETSRRLTLMAHLGVSEEFVSQVGELALDEETIARATEMGKAGKFIVATELLLKDRTLLKRVTTAIARQKLRSYLQLIIRSKGAPAGLLVVASREPREFTAREEQLLSTIAHQIGLAIENVSLYEEQVNKVFQMDALRKTTLDITGQLDLDTVLHSIAARAVQLLRGTGGGLYLYRSDADLLEWAVCVGDGLLSIGTTRQRGEGLSGKVWETGQPLTVGDYRHWEGRTHRLEENRVEAQVGVPVHWQNKFLGVLNVLAEAPRTFSAKDAELLSLFAGQAAIAIENARLYDEARKRAEELALLNRVITATASTLELQDVLEAVATEMAGAFGVGQCALALLDDTGQELTVVAEYLTPTRSSALGEVIPVKGNPSTERVLETGTALAIANARNDPLLAPVRHLMEKRGTKSLLIVPLPVKGKVIGTIGVDFVDTMHSFTAEEIALAESIAGQAVVAIENARLYEGAKDRIAELTVLREISLQLNRSLDSAEVLDMVAAGVLRLFHASDVHIFLYDGENDELSFAAGAWAEPDKSHSAYRAPRKDGLTAQVAHSGRPLLVEDTKSHPLFADYEGWRPDLETIGGFPLKAHDQVIGVFNVAFDSRHTFGEHELRLAGLLADQAAIAIENARLYAEQERRASEMTALYDTSLDISRRLALTEVLRSIMNRGVELLHAAGGAVWLHRRAQDDLELVVDYGTPDTFVGGTMRIGEGVTGKVFATGQAMAVEDYRHWEGRSGQFDSDIIGGMLGVPLMWGDQAIGVLNINEIEEPRKFTEEEVRLLTLFANQAAVAIQNARLHEEQERRAEEMTALYDTALDISGRLELPDVLRSIMVRGVELLGASGAAIWLYRPDDEELEFIMEHGGLGIHVGQTVKLGEGLAGKALQAGDATVVEDYRQWDGRLPQLDSGEVGGMVGVPLMWGEQPIGVLEVYEREKPRHFTEEDVRLLTLFGNQAAAAIQNARLYEETRRREGQLAALHDVSLEIAGELDLTVLLRTVVQGAIDLVGGPSGGLYLYRPERQELERVVHLGSGHDYLGITLSLGEGACGKAAQTGQPLVVLGYANWEGRSTKFEAEGNLNVLAVPIRHGESLLGALYVNDPNLERRFDEADIRLATMFANQAAIAIENVRLHQEQQQRAQELTALHETALDITRHLDLDRLLAAVVARATRLLDAPSGDIFLYRPDSDDLKSVASWGMPPQLQGTALKRGEGLTGRVFEAGEPLAVEDYGAWDGHLAQYTGRGFSRALGAPMRYGTRSVGVLLVDRPADAPPFSESDANLLTLFANQAAIAIENAQLLSAVAQHKENLQGLSSRLIDAQEQERKRIAQELHDEMGQALTAMSINLSTMNKQLGAELDPEIAERLAETDSLITRTLEQMRELALDLRPSMLDDLGLLPALRWHIKRYEARTGIRVGLEVLGLEVRLPEHIETTIYRVVQEALTNVARHAGASRVDIHLQQRDSIVEASIEDNGSGFDPSEVADRDAQKRGVGLVGMQERIGAVGGSLEIKSQPGKGTRLVIQLPLP